MKNSKKSSLKVFWPGGGSKKHEFVKEMGRHGGLWADILNKKVRITLIKGLGRLDWPKTLLKNCFYGISSFFDYWPNFLLLFLVIPWDP